MISPTRLLTLMTVAAVLAAIVLRVLAWARASAHRAELPKAVVAAPTKALGTRHALALASVMGLAVLAFVALVLLGKGDPFVGEWRPYSGDTLAAQWSGLLPPDPLTITRQNEHYSVDSLFVHLQMTRNGSRLGNAVRMPEGKLMTPSWEIESAGSSIVLRVPSSRIGRDEVKVRYRRLDRLRAGDLH